MSNGEVGLTAAQVATAALLGRALLACLPAGAPGGHAPRDLPATWAASHLLGLLATLAGSRLVGERIASSSAFLATLAVAAVVLASALWFLGPLALVPRHEPPRERASVWASLVRLAAIAVVCHGAVEAPRAGTFDAPQHAFGLARLPLAFQALNGLALVAFVEHGLERARAAPLVRAACALAAAIVVHREGFADGTGAGLLASLGLTAGAACSIPWVRRADRRELVLAALGFATCALVARGGIGFALAAGAWACTATARPSLRRCASVMAPSIGCAALLGLTHASPPRGSHLLVDGALVSRLAALVLVAAGFAIAWRAARRGRARTPASFEPRDATQRWLPALALGFVALDVVARTVGRDAAHALELGPACVAVAALVLGDAVARARSSP